MKKKKVLPFSLQTVFIPCAIFDLPLLTSLTTALGRILRLSLGLHGKRTKELTFE